MGDAFFIESIQWIVACQLTCTMYDATDFQNVLVNDVEDQIATKYDHADILAKGFPCGCRFRKAGELPAPGAQLLDIADRACRIVARNEIADLLDIAFRLTAEAKAHQAAGGRIMARYLASSRSSTASPSSAESPVARPSSARRRNSANLSSRSFSWSSSKRSAS